MHSGAERGLGGTSAASAAIVAEARRDDDLPLFLICAGPLTNVAAAVEQAPDTAGRLRLVWAGGALTAGAPEYNRDTDPEAAEPVLGRPDLDVWQFPLETYRRCAYSVAELEQDLARSGRIGRWLWARFLGLPLPDWIRLGGAVRRVYTDVDTRLLFGDLLARLRAHESREASGWPEGR